MNREVAIEACPDTLVKEVLSQMRCMTTKALNDTYKNHPYLKGTFAHSVEGNITFVGNVSGIQTTLQCFL